MSLKERLRGIVAAVATAALAFSVAPVTAMAAPIGGNSITIGNLEQGDEVTLYQVVKTDVDETTNVASNSFVADFGVDFDTEWTEANKEAAANTIASYVNIHKGEWGGQDGHTMYGPNTVASGATSVEFTGVDAGQYLVLVTSESDATRVYQNTIVTVEYDTEAGEYVGKDNGTVELKYTNMTPDDGSGVVDKKINGKDAVDNVDANDTVTFTITSLIPRYVANLDSRVYTLTDVMSDGFVYADNLEVKADNTVLTKGTDYTLGSEDGFFSTITLTKKAFENYAGATLTVTYKATLATGANTPGYLQNESNKATLEFSKNSIDDAKGTAEDTVYMTVYGLQFRKVGPDEEALEGAHFQVKDAEGNVIAESETNSDGALLINGALAAGQQYTLVEDKAPAGYKPIADLLFTIDSNDNDGDGIFDGILANPAGKSVITDEKNDIFSVLPQTGGPGTIALTVAGAGLVAGAAYLVIRSRKEN